MTKRERFLVLFLRIMGAVSFLAVFCAVMPYAWMNAVHRGLGMGILPDEPVVGYLARSTSAFYALLGGLLWVLSFDLRRHRLVLCYLGGAFVAFGLLLWGVDWLEGMPRFWSLAEGPLDVGFGLVTLLLSYRIERWDPRSPASPGGNPAGQG